MIPQPQTNGSLLVALDDYLNPKTGKKIFGCARMFDHAAKQNQSRYPWAQNVVAIGLLKVIKGRWAGLPLSQRYYFTKDHISKNHPTFKGKQIAFQNKHQQAVEMLAVVGKEFPRQRILVVADSWFGNQGLWKPLRKSAQFGWCGSIVVLTSITWVYTCHLNKTPSRRHAVKGRRHFAFSDVRRLIAQEALAEDFQLVCPLPRQPSENTFAAAFMMLAA